LAHTRIQLLSARQHNGLTGLLDAEEHIAVKVAYVIYQKIIAAYPNRHRGKKAMTTIIDSILRGVPPDLRRSPNSAAPYGAAATTSWRSSTTTPPTDPPKPSTDDWKHCAATPSDSETSPTTEGAHCCTAAHSTTPSTHSELRRASQPADRRFSCWLCDSLWQSSAIIRHLVSTNQHKLEMWAEQLHAIQQELNNRGYKDVPTTQLYRPVGTVQ
jgi:hypothetical protein